MISHSNVAKTALLISLRLFLLFRLYYFKTAVLELMKCRIKYEYLDGTATLQHFIL